MAGLAGEVEGRILRGLALWRDYRGQLEVNQAGYWLVPSESRRGLLHRVSTAMSYCSCEDHRYSGHMCLHLWCATFEEALLAALPQMRFADNPYDPEDVPGIVRQGRGRRERSR